MALRRRDEIKIVENTNVLEVKPLEDEAWRVKRIEVKGAGAGEFAEVYVGRTIVGYFACNLQGYNHLAPVISGTSQRNIFDVLREKGKPLIIPVAEGESFIVKLPSSVDFIKITYDVYDAPDVKPTEPNGSKSNELTYIAYLTNAKEWASGDYYTLDEILNPPEFPNFPVDAVPAKAVISVLAVMGIPLAASVGDGSATLGTSYTKRLRIYHQREVLFDPDRLGWLFLGNSAYTETSTSKSYDYTEVANEIPFNEDYNKRMKFLDPELNFGSGEEVNIQVVGSIDPDVSIEAGKLNIALLLKVVYTK